MIKFTLIPFDVLFFGSSKPFNLNVQEAISIFPPFPSTLASAICGKIFSERKIDVSGILKKIYGPFLEKDKKILFPKPLDILIEKKKKDGEISMVKLFNNFKLINPSYTDTQELKEILWENKKGKEFGVFEGFITLEGLKKWLKNQDVGKEDVIFQKDIFEFESRIGIKMDYSKNVTKGEDALYRIDFIKLKDDVKIIFYVEFNFENEELKKCKLENEEKVYDFFKNSEIKILKLGGEMRNVRYDCESKDIKREFEFCIPDDVKENDIIKILYLTPGFLEKNFSYEILNGSIKTTNLGMLRKNYINRKMVIKKIRRGLKEGSVIYAKVRNSEKLKEIWLNPDEGDFIGSNLRIYAKI